MPSDLNLVVMFAGSAWRSAALRALAVFVLGYLAVPLLLARHSHGASLVQFVASALSFVLVAIALFRLLRLPPEADVEVFTADDEAVEAVEPGPLWTPSMLQGLPPTRLEMLAAGYYREKGIRVDACQQKAWGGLMLRLFQDEGEEATSLVRCKASDGQPIERRQVEELLRVMVENAVPKAFLIAPDGFSDEAAKLARSAHITPIDGRLLLAMLNRLGDDARARLLALVTPPPDETPAPASA